MFHVFEYSVLYHCCKSRCIEEGCKYEIREGTSSSSPPSCVWEGYITFRESLELTYGGDRRVTPRQQALIEGGGSSKSQSM